MTYGIFEDTWLQNIGFPQTILTEIKNHLSADSLLQAVLIAYVIGISGFNRSFARLNISIAGIPIFVGEAVLGILLLSLIVSSIRTRRSPFLVGPAGLAIFAYMGIGVIFALGGLRAGYGLAVFRDFAIVYYSAFFFIALAFISQTGRLTALLAAMVAGASIGSLITVVRFAVSPQLVWEHAGSGALGLLSWIALIYLITTYDGLTSRGARLVYVVAVIACGLAIYLSGTRTLLLVMLASLVVLWAARLLPAELRIPAEVPRRVSAALLALVLLVVVTAQVWEEQESPPTIHGSVTLPQGLQTLSRRWVRTALFVASFVPGRESDTAEVAMEIRESDASGELASDSDTAELGEPDSQTESAQTPRSDLVDPATGASQQDTFVENSFSFRLDAWRKAVERIASSPWLGIGYGPEPGLHTDGCDLPASPISNCGNAHNTYLTLIMRMGIPVFLFFAAINAYILWGVLRAVIRHDNKSIIGPLGLLTLVAYLSFALYASTSLFFESPYLSSLYWINLGIMHHLGSSHLPAMQTLRARAG